MGCGLPGNLPSYIHYIIYYIYILLWLIRLLLLLLSLSYILILPVKLWLDSGPRQYLVREMRRYSSLDRMVMVLEAVLSVVLSVHYSWYVLFAE